MASPSPLGRPDLKKTKRNEKKNGPLKLIVGIDRCGCARRLMFNAARFRPLRNGPLLSISPRFCPLRNGPLLFISPRFCPLRRVFLHFGAFLRCAAFEHRERCPCLFLRVSLHRREAGNVSAVRADLPWCSVSAV